MGNNCTRVIGLGQSHSVSLIYFIVLKIKLRLLFILDITQQNMCQLKFYWLNPIVNYYQRIVFKK